MDVVGAQLKSGMVEKRKRSSGSQGTNKRPVLARSKRDLQALGLGPIILKKLEANDYSTIEQKLCQTTTRAHNLRLTFLRALDKLLQKQGCVALDTNQVVQARQSNSNSLELVTALRGNYHYTAAIVIAEIQAGLTAYHQTRARLLFLAARLFVHNVVWTPRCGYSAKIIGVRAGYLTVMLSKPGVEPITSTMVLTITKTWPPCFDTIEPHFVQLTLQELEWLYELSALLQAETPLASDLSSLVLQWLQF